MENLGIALDLGSFFSLLQMDESVYWKDDEKSILLPNFRV